MALWTRQLSFRFISFEEVVILTSFLSNFELLSSEFALRLFPPVRELSTCSSSFKSSRLVPPFQVSTWCLLKNKSCFVYQTWKTCSLFAPPGSLSPLVLALKFSACYCWSYSSCDVVHACCFFYHGYLPAPYAKCGNKTPVKRKNWMFFLGKRKHKRKRPWFLRDSLLPCSQLLVADKRFMSKAPKHATVWPYLVE